jgi:hypothetical protein
MGAAVLRALVYRASTIGSAANPHPRLWHCTHAAAVTAAYLGVSQRWWVTRPLLPQRCAGAHQYCTCAHSIGLALRTCARGRALMAAADDAAVRPAPVDRRGSRPRRAVGGAGAPAHAHPRRRESALAAPVRQLRSAQF